MKLRRSILNFAVSPNISAAIATLARSSVRSLLAQTGDITAMTDSSTGTAGSSIPAINTQDAKVAVSGTNLASRTAFNTAIGKTNNAFSVLTDWMNTNGHTIVANTAYGEGNGTVAVAGTVPAQDKTVAGVDGSAGNAMLRSEFNAAIVRARNNLATVIASYNELAYAIGVPELANNSNGVASQARALSNAVTAGTAVASGDVAAGDMATKAAADAALTALANAVAHVASKINASLFLAGSSDQSAADSVVVLVP